MIKHFQKQTYKKPYFLYYELNTNILFSDICKERVESLGSVHVGKVLAAVLCRVSHRNSGIPLAATNRNASRKHIGISVYNIEHAYPAVRSAGYVYSAGIGNAACNVIVGNLLDVGGMACPTVSLAAYRLYYNRLYAFLAEIVLYRVVGRFPHQVVALCVENIVEFVFLASAVQKEHEQSLAFLLRVNVGNTARKIVDDALWLAVDT